MSHSNDSKKEKSETSLFSLNERAAQAFAEIAEYLYLKDENPFKVKAYEKAVRVLRDLDQDLCVLHQQGALQSIPGVGKAIAEKLESFLATGKIALLEELKREIPPGLVTISALPGLGAKKTVLLHQALGVCDLGDLESACLEGRVQTVKGFSQKSEEKLLLAVQNQRAQVATFRKDLLEQWGEQLSESLSRLAGVDSVLVVGGVRRKIPFSPNLELLLVCRDPLEVEAKLFESYSLDLESGETGQLRLRHPSGCPVILHLCSGSAGAWQSVVTTGPSALVEQLKLDCDPLELVNSSTELEVFGKAAWPFLIPELRDYPRFWRTSPQPPLEVSQIRGNLHAHSDWSDGKNTITEMVTKARELGHQYFGLSDHSRSLVVANGLTRERLLAQGDAVREVDKSFSDIKVFHSLECDILESGELDFPADVLQGLDYVVAAVHSFFHQSKEQMTQRLMTGLSSEKVKILAHPAGRKWSKREGIVADWESIFGFCAQRGIALELNSSPSRLDLSEELLSLAIDCGCLFAINTDAHSCAEFAFLEHGVDMARRQNLGADRVINCWSVDRLEAWLRNL